MNSLVEREAQHTLSKHGKSFRWAQTFLGRRESRDAAIVYAFCRAVDDAADEAPSREAAEREVNELSGMLKGTTTSSELVAAYLEVAERTGFGLQPAQDLLDGVKSDLGEVRLEDDAELAEYCYRVAGTVGLMMANLLGVRDRAALRNAVHLGMAMQLTNICRDVREDAALGRVYLPESRLRRVGLRGDDILRASESGDEHLHRSLSVVVAELLDVAEVLYESGRSGYSFLPVRARLAIAVAASLYRGIGHKLKRGGSRPWNGRVYLRGAEKLWKTAAGLGAWLQSSIFTPKATVAGLLPSAFLKERVPT